jgi:hypothetical protein
MMINMKNYSFKSRKMVYEVFKIAHNVYTPSIVYIGYSEAIFNHVIFEPMFKIIAMGLFVYLDTLKCLKFMLLKN